MVSSDLTPERAGWKGTGKENWIQIGPRGLLAPGVETCCEEHAVGMVENLLN